MLPGPALRGDDDQPLKPRPQRVVRTGREGQRARGAQERPGGAPQEQ